MDVRLEFLRSDQFPQVHRTFLAAFADYSLDMSYLQLENHWQRMVKNGVILEHSVGVFAGERMVGFTLLGFDVWRGEAAAFDAGTGLVPEVRGRGLAGAMFDFLRPRLRELGVKWFVLEVLQNNEAAIKAYTRNGFSILRGLTCLELPIAEYRRPAAIHREVEVLPLSRREVHSFGRFFDTPPSWETSLSAVARVPDTIHCWGAFLRADPVGFIAYYPGLNWIMGLGVDKTRRRLGIGGRLLDHLMHSGVLRQSHVKLINAPGDDAVLEEFLLHRGFRVYARQYEMALRLED